MLNFLYILKKSNLFSTNRAKPLKWLSNLALEAPMVAWLWWVLLNQSLRDSSAHSNVGVALFFAVWAIYLADRIFDRGQQLPNQPDRKRFADRHWRWLVALLGISIVLGLWFARALPISILGQAAAAAVLTVVYFLLCRFTQLNWRFPLKEVLIGVCFAIAVGIPFETGFAVCHWGGLFVFAWLCSLNCLLISRAESDFDQQDDPNAWFATRPKIQFRYLWLAIVVVVILLFLFQGLPISVVISLLIATVMLALVDRLSVGRPELVYLADACLWVSALVGIAIEVYLQE